MTVLEFDSKFDPDCRRRRPKKLLFPKILKLPILSLISILLIFWFIINIVSPNLCITEREERLTVVERTHFDNTEPFYLHYIKFRKENASMEFRFTEYLSVLSGVYRLKPNKILLHGDSEPTGQYWDKLKQVHQIEFRHRTLLMTAGKKDGKIQKVGFVEHAADMAKLEVLLEYGGLVIDFDVFIIHGQRLRKILETKKSITCFVFDEAYNIGLVGGRKDSQLIRSWRRSYNDIYINDWNFQQAQVSKFVSYIHRDEVYVVDKVCNNPQPQYPEEFFRNYGIWQWKNSMAIHTYERWVKGGFDQINGPDDLQGKLTTYKEMLISIYENHPEPIVDDGFKDEIDPETNMLKR